MRVHITLLHFYTNNECDVKGFVILYANCPMSAHLQDNITQKINNIDVNILKNGTTVAVILREGRLLPTFTLNCLFLYTHSAVSYTHLDVYKRQLVYSVYISEWIWRLSRYVMHLISFCCCLLFISFYLYLFYYSCFYYFYL